MRLSRLFMIFASIILSACATGYQPEGVVGGYSELRIGEDLYRVSFEGNGYTDAERAGDLALLRAAEITLSNGASHFAVIDSERSSKRGTFTTPRTSSTTGTFSTFGGTGRYSAQTTTYGGQTFTISKPTAKNLILLVRDPESFNGPVFDAQILSSGIKKRYGIEP